MRFFLKRSKTMDYVLIILGTMLMGIAIKCIFDPISMVTGGFSGIAIIVRKLTLGIMEDGIPLWLTNLVLNIPLFFVAYRMKGKQFIGRTMFATFMLSAWLYVIPSIDLSQNDYVLSALFGGVIQGAGIGFVLLSKATTGGTDMVAAIIQCKLKHYSIAQILQFIDGAIVLVGCYVFGIQAALYAIATIVITTKVSDALMEGFKYSKAVYIISEHSKEISECIFESLDRGVTGIAAKGLYSGQEKCMLYCVVSKKQLVTLKDIVMRYDEHAFMIVSDVREVFGEGFIEGE